jgi:hypothetical protein
LVVVGALLGAGCCLVLVAAWYLLLGICSLIFAACYRLFLVPNSDDCCNVLFSPGQILANSGASATSVVCVFRTATNPNEATTSALTTDGRSHIRLTLVETHSTNGTTTLPAVLVEGEFSFSPSSPQNMQHSLEIHHYGDLVTEHVGDSYGTVPSKSSKKSFNQCPSTTTRMGFLGDVVNTGSGGSGGGVVTEYTALLPPGTSTLHSLVGRSCVLKSGKSQYMLASMN